MFETNRSEIRLIIYEYLAEELKSKGFNWTLDQLDLNENEIALNLRKRKQIVDALCKLSYSIRTTFNDNLNQMCLMVENKMNDNKSNLIDLDYESFKSVADELFSFECKWSHLICLLLFSTKLIIFKINDNRCAELTKNICDYLTNYLSKNLLNWINSQKAWIGLLEYYDSLNYDCKSNLNNKFKSSKFKFDATIGFLGFALFGIFLFNKH